jgi:hypothetical protein
MGKTKIIEKLESIEDLIKRLEYLYDVVDESINKKQTVKYLLKYYIDKERDINEYKTILIISSDFISDVEIHMMYIKLTNKLNTHLNS